MTVSPTMRLIVNYLAFQAGWFACVLGAANGYPALGPVVVLAAFAWHLSVAERPATECLLLVYCAFIGLVFDSLLLSTGWVSFPNGILLSDVAPYWMVALWVAFGSTLNLSMAWLRGRPWLAAVFGAVGGPLSYLAGAGFGAMTLNERTAALLALAAGWAVIMPLLAMLASRYDGFTRRRLPPYVQGGWNRDGASSHV